MARDILKNRKWKREYAKNYYASLRKQVIDMLGGRCIQCGFSDYRALHLDHINGGGTKEIKKLGPGRYKFYLENNCEGIQILCANCNAIKKNTHKQYPFGLKQAKGFKKF